MDFASTLLAQFTLQEVPTQNDNTPFWVILIIVLVLLLILWWGLTRNKSSEETAVDAHADDAHADKPVDEEIHEPEPAAPQESTRETAVPITPPQPDDLKKIEGIGPKIESILNDAGITTFAQLADTDVDTLDQIVRKDAGITIAHPASWPEQAQLAAAGEWDALEKLQDALTAGRQ